LIAAEAAALHQAGVTLKAIGARFSVDDHTAAKAVRWFRQRSPRFFIAARAGRTL